MQKPIKNGLILLAAFFALNLNLSAQDAAATDPSALFDEAQKAFTDKEYAKAATTLKDLIAAVKDQKEAPLELLKFNLGLAYLLDDKAEEAEAALTDCVKQFPTGEYASRAFLGIGRAAIAQGGEAKQEIAIAALKRAAADPKYRAEAGLTLGQLYDETGKTDEALKVFSTLMGSDVRTPQQTAASVEVIGLLAQTDKVPTLVSYLGRLIDTAGVRDAICWYANQVVVKADELVGQGKYDAALLIYRTIPTRAQILAVQAETTADQKKRLAALQERVKQAEKLPLGQRTNLSELVGGLEAALKLTEEATAAIEKLTDLDSAMLMRRGRCYFYLDRLEEALICFAQIREKFPSAADARSAAFAEIVIYNKLKDLKSIEPLADAYLKKYPDADNAEQVATLAGEILAQNGDWPKVLEFYQQMEAKYPNSESVDRFVFFQGVALFQNGQFKESIDLLDRFIKTYPQSQLQEAAVYRIAMAYFLTNDYKNTLQWCREYVNRYPDGLFTGDMLYRLAFIDFNDKEEDQSERIISSLTGYLERHPEDPAAGSMYCLMGDTYRKMTSDKEDVMKQYEDSALNSYSKAVWTASPDEVITYALESATTILQARQDWQGVVDLHQRFLTERPNHQMAMASATWVSKGMQRLGKPEEGAKLLAETLAKVINDPAKEQVEMMIDEIAKNLAPRRVTPDTDKKALEAKLTDILTEAAKGKENFTTDSRINYGKAKLALLLRDPDLAETYVKRIANFDGDVALLSPAILAACGETLVKEGDLDKAEKMFQRLADRYKESSFSDAGPVGLGLIALERKEPEKALKIFDDALTNIPGMSKYREATIGKLEALAALGKYDDVKKLAMEVAGDKSFRGYYIPKAYMILADSLVKQGDTLAAAARIENLKEAHGYYQRVYTAYQRETEICAEAYFKAYETAKAFGNKTLADETLKTLVNHPKLKDTEYQLKAKAL